MKLSFYPPDPTYDCECTPGLMDWRVLKEGTDSPSDVITPDFGAKDRLIRLPAHEFMQRDFESDLPSKAQVDEFLWSHFGLMRAINDLSEFELKALREELCQSEAYLSSRELKREYINEIIDDIAALRPLEQHSAIFFASFVDQFLLQPVNERLKLLEAESKKLSPRAQRA